MDRDNLITEINRVRWSEPFARYLILTSGMTFFTAGYVVSSGNILPLALPTIYGSANYKSVEFAKISLRVGMLLGQLIFGVVGDLYGRRRACNLTLMLILAGTLSSCVLGDGPGLRIAASLVIIRGLLGIAIGGIYSTAILTVSEFAPTDQRPTMLATIFLAYICGSFFALLITVAALAGSTQIDSIWRLVIGLGLVPGIMALGLCRLRRIPETPYYKADVERDFVAANEIVDYAQGKRKHLNRRDPIQHNGGILLWGRGLFRYMRRDFRTYVAICGAWFIVDASAYGYRSDIRLQDIDLNQNVGDIHGLLMLVSTSDAIRVSLGSIIGAIMTLVFIAHLSRKRIMYLGFGFSAILFIVFGFFSGKMGYIPYLTISTMVMNCGPRNTVQLLTGLRLRVVD
ncbi:3521_t:CDS:2 [Paraglomus brasilianum]|uniref:3521_t:CDS:1 n=1 Tax=Paraglomus brasilianum TaxID=144538 RepID=A0A9N9BT51_9GLOM|nr:3521_t:CDS:2 [Paraglomus brasilianum]